MTLSPKKSILIEMPSGVSGDMLVSALLSFDFSLSDSLNPILQEIAFNSGYKEKVALNYKEIKRGGILSTQIQFKIKSKKIKNIEEKSTWHTDTKNQHHKHSHLKDILNILNQTKSISDNIKQKSESVFRLLAEAEASVHGMTTEKVHFHEVGELDALLDVVSFCYLCEQLNIDQIYTSHFTFGNGTVKCQHGLMPVPVPAVVKIAEIKKLPIKYVKEETGELSTPTGCAILGALATSFFLPQNVTLLKSKYGAGHKNIPNRVNILRICLVENFHSPSNHQNTYEEDKITLIETNIDDHTSENISYLFSSLLKKSALDVWTEPIYMKKNRLATKLCVLIEFSQKSEMINFILAQEITLGVRIREEHRYKLKRQSIQFEYNKIKFYGKEAFYLDTIKNVQKSFFKIEADSINQFAQSENISFNEAQRKLKAIYLSSKKSN